MTQPITKSLTVPLPPKDAFDLFTAQIDTWWPKDTHSLSAADGHMAKKVHIDPKLGGDITETKPNGDTAQWGRVTKWDPGRTFGMSWFVGRDESEATDVLVVFARHDLGTQVTLTHSGFNRLGTEAANVQTQYNTGWDFVLGDCYLRKVLGITNVGAVLN